MARVRRERSAGQPTPRAPLAERLADPQTLGLDRWLDRPTRGRSPRGFSGLGLLLAWPGRGRPAPLAPCDEPLRPAPGGGSRRPTADTRRRRLTPFPTPAVRRAGEAAYPAERPRRPGR